jgi:hypothetical protein
MANIIVGSLMILVGLGVGYYLIKTLNRKGWRLISFIEEAIRIILVLGVLVMGVLFLMGVMNVFESNPK